MLAYYNEFRDFLERTSGIVLGDNKEYLVSSRLTQILRENEIADLGALMESLQRMSGSPLKQQVIDAMTTNETQWFRDNHPYMILKNKLLPGLKNAGGMGLRVWSSACSSGQEPYSISILIDEYNSENPAGKIPRAEIVATDLSSKILDAAKEGVYDELALKRGLTPERRQRHFSPLNDNRWQVKQQIKSRIKFQPLNLLDNYRALGKFDIIFCRNVLIYFSPKVKQDILTRMHACLKPGGYLFVGSSEALNEAGKLFDMQHCNPGIVYCAK